MQSPLRYPGSKSDFINTAIHIIEDNGFSGLPIVEPYAGSAAVTLGLLNAKVVKNATLIERDPLVYSFWQCVFERPDDLISAFSDLPITLETWHNLHPLLSIDSPPSKSKQQLQLGLACLFFNRANFSGILNAGPIGGKEQKSEYKIDCRTNKEEITSRIQKIAQYAECVNVEFGDAIEAIKRYRNRKKVFFYIDPPYFQKGESLYRYAYKLKEHKLLAQALTAAKFPWVLSYDVHHVIEFLYEDFHVKKCKFQYSARSPKNHEELVVSNFTIKQSSLDIKHQKPKRVRATHNSARTQPSSKA